MLYLNWHSPATASDSKEVLATPASKPASKSASKPKEKVVPTKASDDQPKKELKEAGQPPKGEVLPTAAGLKDAVEGEVLTTAGGSHD
jgi:hypothetical protein